MNTTDSDGQSLKFSRNKAFPKYFQHACPIFFASDETTAIRKRKDTPLHTPLKMSLELPMVLPVVYQWKSAVKFGGITTGKTVDFCGKSVVFPLLYQWITVV